MMHIKYNLNKYLKDFSNDRVGFLLLRLCYLFGFSLVLSMPIFTFRSGFNLITNILSLLFCISCSAYIYLRKEFRFDFFIVPLVVFCAYSIISWSVTQYNVETVKSTITLYALIFFIYQFAVNTDSVKKFLFIYVIGGVILALLIFTSEFSAIISLDFGRLGAKYGNLNDVGLDFAFCGVICLFFDSKKISKIIFKYIIYIIFFIFILLTGSRAALLLYITGSFVYHWLIFSGKRKAIFFLFILLFVLLLIFVLNIPVFQNLKERIFDVFISLLTGGDSDEASADSRLLMLKEGLYLWLQSPLFGHGLESFRYITNFNLYAHASIADMLCNLGIVGMFLWIFPIIYSAICGLGESKRLSLTIAIGFLFPGLFCAILSTSKLFMLIYCLGICAVSSSINNLTYIAIKSNHLIPMFKIQLSNNSLFYQIRR